MRRQTAALVALALLGACADARPPAPAGLLGEGAFPASQLAMDDGTTLPFDTYRPAGPPRAVVLALHGFNDYRKAFDQVGPKLARAGLIVYAADQRGFGETDTRGLWPGTARLAADTAAMVRAIRSRHPGRPLYLLGESMGGAIAMAALAGRSPTLTSKEIDGLVLIAPAVWGRKTMPALQVAGLAVSNALVPWMRVSGSGLGFVPSDNQLMLYQYSSDPLVIRRTRVDAVAGLVDLMDEALDAAPRLTVPSLILYGVRDDIVPRAPTCRMIESLPGAPTGRWRVALYGDGYHMLLRDLGGTKAIADIAFWMRHPAAPLPSGAEAPGAAALPGRRAPSLCRNVGG
jgi:alpha-beta hydrolase superfamily lysophospholipase